MTQPSDQQTPEDARPVDADVRRELMMLREFTKSVLYQRRLGDEIVLPQLPDDYIAELMR